MHSASKFLMILLHTFEIIQLRVVGVKGTDGNLSLAFQWRQQVSFHHEHTSIGPTASTGLPIMTQVSIAPSGSHGGITCSGTRVLQRFCKALRSIGAQNVGAGNVQPRPTAEVRLTAVEPLHSRWEVSRKACCLGLARSSPPNPRAEVVMQDGSFIPAHLVTNVYLNLLPRWSSTSSLLKARLAMTVH
jgi:hypothetical protein